MNLFLSEPWVRVMASSGTISRVVPVILHGDTVHVGEYQAFGLKKWCLFGAFDELPEQKLLELFVQARQQGIFKVESDFNMSRWQNRAFLAAQTTITRDFGTYLVDLTQPEEGLWEQMHPKHRNMTRRAIQDGVVVRWQLEMEEFLLLMKETYARGGREQGFSLGYLQALERILGPRLLVGVAMHGGTVQAALILPFDDQCGYYLHGASRTDGRPGASNLLHWEAMRVLKSERIKFYDLGGAMEETDDPRLAGIFRFKKRFGGVFLPCYHWEKILSTTRHWLHERLRKFNL
ncbi:MAG: peptidoglycan bridge formation glycyltransferase FemA/FemB family protein [Magnetococcus sp. YQC-5]